MYLDIFFFFSAEDVNKLSMNVQWRGVFLKASSTPLFKLCNRLFSCSSLNFRQAPFKWICLTCFRKEEAFVGRMFSYCSSVQCNLRVRTRPSDLCRSSVLTPHCRDSCWDTQVFNRAYNSRSLWNSACFTKKCFTTAAIKFPNSHSFNGWVQLMHVFTTARELIDWRNYWSISCYNCLRNWEADK